MAGAFQSDAFQNDAFQAVNDTNGALSVTGTATVVFGARRVTSGSITSSGIGALGATGTLDTVDLAFQSGAFQVGAFQTAGTGPVDGAIAFSATGTLGPAGERDVLGLWDQTGTGAISLNGSLSDDLEGFWAVEGTGSLAGSASILLSGAWAVTGTGVLGADGTLDLADNNIEGAWAVTGVGSLEGAGMRRSAGAWSVAGVGTLSGAPAALEWAGALDLVAEASLGALGARVLPIQDPPVPYVKSVVDTPRNIVIKVNGVDVTPIVRYADARFQSQVNGSAAPCFLAVRDLDHTQGFTTGHEITLDVDGVRRWTGFVTKIRRQYSSAVVDTTEPAETARWFAIDGVDLNILFQKRIVFNKGHPENGILAPPPGWRDAKHPDQWKAETPAYVIVRHVLATRTDLLADGVDLSGVTMLDSPNPDFAAAFTGAMTVGDFMRSVNRLLGGIFYLTPTKRLMYHPVETATTNFYLTDTPYGDVTDLSEGFDTDHATGWGTGPLGSWVNWVGDEQLAVSGGTGVWTVPPGFSSSFNDLVPAPNTSGDSWEASTKFQWPSDFRTLTLMYLLWYEDPDFNHDVYLSVAANADGAPEPYYIMAAWDSPTDNDDLLVPLLTEPQPDEWWQVKMEWIESTGTIRAKAWKDGDTEPDWMVSLSTVPFVRTEVPTWGLELGVTNYDPFATPNPETVWNFDSVSAAVATGNTGPVTDAVGPQDYSLLSDAAAMVNDALVWGTAPGVDTVTFKRETDTTERDRHGLWQYGEFNETMYKQASVNKRANALVYGNVASRLGAHYDRIAAEATVYAPIFFLGDVVRCEQRVYDGPQDPPLDGFGSYVAINLPVRRLTITFPTKTSTRWNMLITQELDDPWNIYEYVFPRFNFGGFPRFDPPPPPILTGGVPCSEGTYRLVNIGGNFTNTGPFTGLSSLWLNGWGNWIDEIEGVLSFPGTDVAHPFPNDPSNRLNKVSPDIQMPFSDLVVELDSIDAGGGPAPTEIGYTGADQNFDLIGTPPRTYELGQNNGSGDVFVAVSSSNLYNANLDGVGSYSYMPGVFGSSDDTAGVVAGAFFLQLAQADIGQRIAYNAASPWNRDAVTVNFRFTVSRVDSTATIRLKAGAAEVQLKPNASTGEISLVSDSGATSQAYTDWTAFAWYVARVTLDLATNRIRVVFGPEGGSTVTLTRAANGERVGDGTYRPFVGIRLNNPDASVVRLNADLVYASAYADAFDTETSLFGGGSGTSGWGAPWVVYPSTTSHVPGPDTNVVYDADGSIRVLGPAANGGHIARPIEPGMGAVDVAFSMSNYPAGTGSILRVYLEKQVTGSGGTLQTMRNQVNIGNTLQCIAFTGGSTVSQSGSTTLFSSGAPVNVRIQLNNGVLRAKVWAVGTAQPDAWNVSAYFGSTAVNWNARTFVFGLQYLFAETAGNKVTLGDVITDTAASPSWLVTGPNILSNTNVIPFNVGGSGSGNHGRAKSWPFSDPGDGRAYAVAWGSDSYTVGNVGTPGYLATVVWGQFGDLGPGVPEAVAQTASSSAVTQPLLGGVPAEFTAKITGEMGLALNGFSSGSGVATVLAALQTYNHGLAITAPPPAVSDYFINGRDEDLHEFNLVEGGVVIWVPFEIDFDSEQQDGYGVTAPDSLGFRNLLWGVKVFDAFTKIREAGPFDQNGFLTVHHGSISTAFRKLTGEIRLKTVPVIGVAKPDPCLPIPTTSGSGSQQGSGAPASTDFESQGVEYNVGTSYVPGSVEVTIDGELQMPIVDFEETDYIAGDVTLANVPGPTKIIHIEWVILGGP